MFKRWIEVNQKAKNELKPDFGLRSWDKLNSEDKYAIWKYMELHFFDKNLREERDFMGDVEGRYYHFFGNNIEVDKKKERIGMTILKISEYYKAKNYAPRFLEKKSLNAACADFYTIFSEQRENVVLELLSIFALEIINQRKDDGIKRAAGETDEEYNQKLDQWRFEIFDKFAARLNEVFADYSLDISLTRLGFVTRQEEKIEEEIYKPVLSKLSNIKWKEVNRDLADAFKDYRNGDYSGCITHVISGIQAFLQILVNGKTGKDEISKLIPRAKTKKLIPDDDFSTLFFDQLESYMARARREKGDPHPKKEYATDKNARIVLNLAMVFFEHCL